MKTRIIILASLATFSGILPSARASSLSELATEKLEKDFIPTGKRNIFTEAKIAGDVEISSLTLEGFLIGKGVALALLSGRIVRVGDLIGPYAVTRISAGKIELKSTEETTPIKMDGYVRPLRPISNQQFAIEFRNADIRDSLKMLALAAGYNLITPEDIQGRVNLHFKNTSIRHAIKSILKVNDYNFAIENGIMRVGTDEQFKGGTDLLATTFKVKYARAKDLEDGIKLLLSDKGTVSADARTNILSVRDYDANVENVRNLLAMVDKKDQQVHIEAHIVDASNDFSRSIGVNWAISGSPGRVEVAGADSTGTLTVGSNDAVPASVSLGASSPTSGSAFRIGSIPGATNIDFQVTAAEERGDVKIISKPSVTTINNMPAKIRSGVTLYVKANSDINVGTTASTSTATSSELEEIETGIELTVTPQITPDRYIKLTLEAEESEADFSKTVDGIPSVIDNVATTTIFLKDGETAVIGGLIKRKDSLTKKRVPGISKIPVIGLFFKSKTKKKTHTEVMIFITPRII